MLSGGFDGMFNHENWDHHLSTMIFHHCHGGIMRISQILVWWCYRWKSRTAGLVHEASYWVYGRYIKLIKTMGIMATTGFASQKLQCENTGKNHLSNQHCGWGWANIALSVYLYGSMDPASAEEQCPFEKPKSLAQHSYIILYICLLLTVCNIYICICIYIIFIY